MSKDATHLEPNDLLSLVRLGKFKAELALIVADVRRLEEMHGTKAAKAAVIANDLNERYGIAPGDVVDDETGEIKRAPKQEPTK